MLKRTPTWLFICALALMPTLMLSTSTGGSKAYYVLLLGSLALLLVMPRSQRSIHGPDRLLCAAFALPLVAAIVSAAANHVWSDVNFERGLRLAIGAPLLLLAMQYIGQERLRHALWGMMLAGVVSTACVIALIFPDFTERPLTPAFNAVTYGNLMLLMAVVALFSIPIPLLPNARLDKAVKLLIAAATFIGFILTQTRSGWIALPIFIMLALVLFTRMRHPLRLGAALLCLLLGVVALGALNPTLRDRAELILSETSECMTDNATADTSICVRLQLWRTSLEMAARHPITGVGSGAAFQQSLREAQQRGQVSEYVASNYGEPHNDLIEAVAVNGLLGAVALLLLYFVPAAVFLQRLVTRQSMPVRAAAAMGAATCLGFAVFGQTELMFRGMRTVGFYVVLVMLFSALSSARPLPQPTAPKDTRVA
ncbi:O-antigen ligase family protein [Pseudomonadota bacterium AL_CKDN230030165-1A_HGKHYDSX7]